MQSAYHNLPTLIGIMQADGESYRAFDVSFDLSDTLCNICMDIAQAYPKKAGCPLTGEPPRCIRTLRL